ncbi:MAG: sigma-54 dependent transcriptional regulator [Planctomycetota bacterium]
MTHIIQPFALVVDDDPDTCQALEDLVQQEGFSSESASCLEEARGCVRIRLPDLVLLDIVLPDGNGLSLMDDLESEVEVVCVTGRASVDSAVEALRRGVLDYLVKPIDVARLQGMLLRIARNVTESQLTAAPAPSDSSLIGRSRPMQLVRQLIEKVAPTRTSVLITGESGTGKEVVAAEIHRLSGSPGPWLPINCGAISASLIESELFGHERGSFTGATRRHIGLFERARGGTIFLDEITEMPLELQVKLLRVLETGTLRRVGGHEQRLFEARIVAATNRRPDQAVSDGALRLDLFYRLAVFPIDLPPLRKRGDDIELLTGHFLRKLCASGVPPRLTPDARNAMKGFSWPGNVRQLRNVLERAFIMSDSDIGIDALPSDITSPASGTSKAAKRKSLSATEQIERRRLLQALHESDGDKRAAAKKLGVSLRTLYNRLHKYGDFEGQR